MHYIVLIRNIFSWWLRWILYYTGRVRRHELQVHKLLSVQTICILTCHNSQYRSQDTPKGFCLSYTLKETDRHNINIRLHSNAHYPKLDWCTCIICSWILMLATCMLTLTLTPQPFCRIEREISVQFMLILRHYVGQLMLIQDMGLANLSSFQDVGLANLRSFQDIGLAKFRALQ